LKGIPRKICYFCNQEIAWPNQPPKVGLYDIKLRSFLFKLTVQVSDDENIVDFEGETFVFSVFSEAQYMRYQMREFELMELRFSGLNV
jgi:hypothetical protein